MSIFELIGRNIVLLRKQKTITQERLALDADLSVSYLRSIEHGEANPSVEVLSRIADALEEPIVHVLTYVEDGEAQEKREVTC